MNRDDILDEPKCGTELQKKANSAVKYCQFG